VGKPIGSVRVSVEERESHDPSLTQVIETLVGQPLSMAAVRESMSHLFSLGRFEGVRVDAELESGRVALKYELSPIHPVPKIEFAGRVNGLDVDLDALRRAIFDRYGSAPPLSRVSDMARLVEAGLAERGYRHATATPTAKVQHAPEQATLTFTLEPNNRTLVGAVDVVGQPTVPRDELLRRLSLFSGAPYQPDRLNTSIERYVAERRTRGYYEARVVPSVTFAEDDRLANVTLDVMPGPHVRVVFTGDDVPVGRREELVPVEREGSADEDLLEDSSNRIEEYFRAQGYRRASAPHTREQHDGELVITFTVSKGPLYRVDTYEITGNTSIALEEISPGLKLRVGQPFVDSRLDADVGSIETLYRRRGFATARARAAFEPQPASLTPSVVSVTVRIVITEGVRTIVDSVEIEGNSAIDVSRLRARLGLQAGGPFVPGQMAVDRDRVVQAFQDLGYQNVAVDVAPEFNADGTRAVVRMKVREGPQIFVGRVIIVGNVRTRTETIERELRVKSGDPFSAAAISESQGRLAALGLFRRVRISELRHGNETTRDLLVNVEEGPLTTIGYGFGAEGRRLAQTTDTGTTERFDVAPRALFEVGRRNLFGKNRSVNLFASVSRSLVSPLTEYRVVATLREPRLFDTPADAFLNGTVEQQHRSTFDFARRSLSASVERRFPGPYRITGAYQLQRTRVFNLVAGQNDPNFPFIDRAFPQFLLSSFSGSLIRDTRDDALDTHSGNYFSANGQLAAHAIGSEVSLVKSFFTAQMFRTISHTRPIVFAGSARLGLATGFTDARLETATGVELTTQGELPASERFFAGGDTTVRGFAVDQLGVRHFPPELGDTIDKDGFAIGGNGLIVLNAELRVPVTGGLGVVAFLDTGNVYARVSTIELAELRSAVGGGIRYKSPVGPLRIDFGVKVRPLPTESRSAWFVSFGQAF
jgi:outer membrane protein assembly complex protein YaeT